ncbi:protein of unknown function [Microbacterium sp. Nx66]|uniref:hypothetical protein n=1 Tax=Microbacterium sp. Nx66 TaxID=2766784 RepID=UPI0016570E57|nr:hypothetical protein [Microbacterium sp. Nx66]CAD5137687.1 protein of unknown function [Microbacterium sp. Nx66]
MAGIPMVRDVRSEQPLVVEHSTWFATITHPRRHLVATLCVWGWFVAVLAGADSVPQLAPALEATAATGAAVWHFAMMRRYRNASRHSSPPGPMS